MVSFRVDGDYQPFSGDFDGNGFPDVFWYAPGAEQDYVWYFTDGVHYVQRPVTVNGVYRPIVGDFNNDGKADVLWYSPGGGPDYWWLGRSDRTFTVSLTSVGGKGAFVPVAADFDHDGNTDILWYAPGAGADFVWWGRGNLHFDWTSVRIDGRYDPIVATTAYGNSILWYSPGSGLDSWWTPTMGRRFDHRPANQPGDYTPVVARGEGFNGTDDIYWYAPGAAVDQAWFSTNHALAYDIHQADVDGANYRPFSFGDGIFWYAPGPGTDTLWNQPRADFAATVGPRWSVTLPGGGEANSLALTPNGDIVVVGNTARNGGTDGVLAELTPDGHEVWHVYLASAGTHGSNPFDNASSVAVDSKGNIYVAGYTDGELGGQHAEHSLFVAQFDSTGHQVWVRQHPGFPDLNDTVVVDGDGRVDVASTTFDNHGHDGALGLLQYDQFGNEHWLAVNDTVRPTCVLVGLAASADGSVYSAGTGSTIVKYDATGHEQWSKTFAPAETICALTADAAGNVYATGGAPLPAGEVGSAAFTARIDSSGNEKWSSEFGDYYGAGGGYAAIKTSDQLVIAGGCGQGLPGSVGDGLLFEAHYDTNGTLESINQYGFPNAGQVTAIAANAQHTYMLINQQIAEVA